MAGSDGFEWVPGACEALTKRAHGGFGVSIRPVMGGSGPTCTKHRIRTDRGLYYNGEGINHTGTYMGADGNRRDKRV